MPSSLVVGNVFRSGVIQNKHEVPNCCPTRWESEAEVLEGICYTWMALLLLMQYETTEGSRPIVEKSALESALAALDPETLFLIAMSADLVRMSRDIMVRFDKGRHFPKEKKRLCIIVTVSNMCS